MVRAVDELHRDGMDSMASDIAELHQGEGARLMGPTRQQLARGIGLGGAAVALGAAMVPLSQLFTPAYAQAGDAGLAAFAQSVELAAVEAYKAAAASGKVTTPAVLEAATTFAGHHTERGGQRSWTAMIYLNQPEDGGATRFKTIGKTVQPETGKLLTWNNLLPDGTPNPATLHQGMRVRTGTKYVLTKWFRERPL